jgi:PAS domain S-box-containing protein
VESLTGYTAGEIDRYDPATWESRIHRDDVENVLKVRKTAKIEGDKYRVEYRSLRKEGRYQHLEETGLFINNEKGQAFRMIGVMKDISERKKYEQALAEVNERIDLKVEEQTEELVKNNNRLSKEVENGRDAERALRESERHYREIVEDQTELVTRLRPDFTVLFINEAYCRYFSIKKEDLLDKDFFHLLHEDHREKVKQFYHSLTFKKPSGTSIQLVKMLNGEERWHQWNARALFDSTGKLSVYQSTGRDITDRIRMEQALRESEERYRAVVEDQTELIVRCQSDFKLTFINEALCRYFSKTKEEMLGKSFIPFVHEKDRGMVKSFYQSLSREIPYNTSTQRVLRKDGSVRWHQWNARALFDEKGQLAGYQAVGHDITDRIKIEQALRESEERYRAVVEDQTELIARHRKDFVMLYVNNALARYYSTTPDNMIGKSFIPLLHEDDRERVAAFYRSLTPEKSFGTDEHKVILKGGEVRWHQWNVRALFDDNKKLLGYQSVGRDITNRVVIERALRESEERYRIVTKHSVDGIVVIQDSLLKYINDAFAYMCGHEDPNQIIGRKAGDFIEVAFRENFNRYMEMMADGKTMESILRAKISRPDGQELWGEGLHTVIQWEGRPAVLATVRDITMSKLRERETKRETQVLRQQNIKLASTIKDRYRFGNLVGKSQPMQEVYEQIMSASASDANVVIYGESGTGKELVATMIHELSDRAGNSFVPVNCGAIPETLMESEFFGHKKGAFTGAEKDKQGYLDFADGGTLFLDEVGDIRASIQVKLLRAIEGGGHTPIGSNQVGKSSFRVIAATNRPLKDLVKQGEMRRDFFFRIHIVPIYLPPLRERKEDILLLVDHFMRTMKHSGDERFVLPGKIIDAFSEYDWPGNVRELQNVLQRYLTVGRLEFESGWKAKMLEIETKLGFDEIDGDDLKSKVDNFEKQLILRSLEKAQWNRCQACSSLKLPRRTLTYKIKKYGINLPR